jgi:hypothetical protein
VNNWHANSKRHVKPVGLAGLVTRGHLVDESEKNFAQSLQVPRARSYISQAKMLTNQISIICKRPLGRIDNVALKRWALFTVE